MSGSEASKYVGTRGREKKSELLARARARTQAELGARAASFGSEPGAGVMLAVGAAVLLPSLEVAQVMDLLDVGQGLLEAEDGRQSSPSCKRYC